jgi:RNA polymerase primary sigma factor
MSATHAVRQRGVPARDSGLDSLELFFAQASRHRLLAAREEIELAKRIERGDLAAKDRLINSNLRLVVHVARSYQGNGLSLGDLVQEGSLGLIRAAEKFDWRKGFRFSTYATIWIRQSIQRGLVKSGRTIRLSIDMEQRVRKLVRAEREVSAKLGRDATDEEIARVAEMELTEIVQLRGACQVPVSLDSPVGDDGAAAFGDLLVSEAAGPVEVVAARERREHVAMALEDLPETERRVIELRFGLGGDDERTVDAAGGELGLTYERVCQLEDQALERLQAGGLLGALRDAA